MRLKCLFCPAMYITEDYTVYNENVTNWEGDNRGLIVVLPCHFRGKVSKRETLK